MTRVIFLCLSLMFTAIGSAQEPNTLTPQEMSDGFVLLFDGKTVSPDIWEGAQNYPVKKNEGCFYCKGGQFRTKKEYSDFIFRFQFKLPPANGNNGVGIRYKDGNPAYTGMEIQILDNFAKQHENLKPAQYHGSIYLVAPSKRNAGKHDYLKPNGEWNEEEITAIGSHIKVVLNGEVIVDADIAKIPLTDEEQKKHTGLHNKSGYIGFLGHGSPVEFRNIRIKEIVE